MIKKYIYRWTTFLAAFLFILTLGCNDQIQLDQESYSLARRITLMPEEIQTKIMEPRERSIYFKLPLLQPIFHWKFNSRNDFLSGKLVLRIIRNENTDEITIFEGGNMTDGWESIGIPPALPQGEIYFGFQSTKKYLTAPGDLLQIELKVTKDLDGIGGVETGILPAGTYLSKGRYSGLIDMMMPIMDGKETFFNFMTEDQRDTVRGQFEYKAWVDNWDERWSLKITSNKGWLSEEQRISTEKMSNLMNSLLKNLIGKPAPDFVLKDIDGKEVKLADFEGKMLIVDFWATWCPPCVKEIPIYSELYRTYMDKGLVIVGISLDLHGTELVRKFADKHKVPYPLIMGNQAVALAYGNFQSIPTTFVIDREGNIVDVAVGYKPKSYFQEIIEGLLQHNR